MKAIIFLLLLLGTYIPFHELSINNIDNETVNFEDFAGKKILIVNTASNSADSSQFRQLEELYQLYKNQLIIIAVPSNDFANEPLEENEIKSLLEERYDVHYLIAKKQIVRDTIGCSPLYQWITHKNKNGMTDSNVQGDFSKYLINGSGQIIGIFSNQVKPLDEVLLTAIKN
ncbi:hypothetical protein [Ferruginibacter sp. HRS2-29]|uniref:hypothetical protein n=1 Tax=Ferruginibacter sp. HRS2-29 TaxID=2487334 RepID=UPI0020CD845A|nr:hypothetical protein [Ferruginibacter sp. HRS2-29]MCP9750011.1 glutathione peroxidase [Ferruginibacter sp. HRS2-29]MCP9750369.1 glutathione peroxidase [Ferruginibacter sp. HRS2-29]